MRVPRDDFMDDEMQKVLLAFYSNFPTSASSCSLHLTGRSPRSLAREKPSGMSPTMMRWTIVGERRVRRIARAYPSSLRS